MGESRGESGDLRSLREALRPTNEPVNLKSSSLHHILLEEKKKKGGRGRPTRDRSRKKNQEAYRSKKKKKKKGRDKGPCEEKNEQNSAFA